MSLKLSPATDIDPSSGKTVPSSWTFISNLLLEPDKTTPITPYRNFIFICSALMIEVNVEIKL